MENGGKSGNEWVLRVEGMTCGHCERTVKQLLEGVPGVRRARVSLPEAKAWVEGEADPAALAAAVAEEGYRAMPIPEDAP